MPTSERLKDIYRKNMREFIKDAKPDKEFYLHGNLDKWITTLVELVDAPIEEPGKNFPKPKKGWAEKTLKKMCSILLKNTYWLKCEWYELYAIRKVLRALVKGDVNSLEGLISRGELSADIDDGDEDGNVASSSASPSSSTSPPAKRRKNKKKKKAPQDDSKQQLATDDAELPSDTTAIGPEEPAAQQRLKQSLAQYYESLNKLSGLELEPPSSTARWWVEHQRWLEEEQRRDAPLTLTFAEIEDDNPSAWLLELLALHTGLGVIDENTFDENPRLLETLVLRVGGQPLLDALLQQLREEALERVAEMLARNLEDEELRGTTEFVENDALDAREVIAAGNMDAARDCG